MTKFSDPNYYLLKEYFDILIATGNRVGTDKSYLIGPNHTVVSQGDFYTILYEDHPDRGYVAHRFSIDEITGNRFKMTYIGLESTFSVASSAFDIGNDFYFRKDSFFHYWLSRPEQDELYHDYCNQDKTFLFFGKIWPDGTSYVIEFEGLKDFTLKGIPEHNQTIRMTEWLKVYWDQVHHEMYNMTKNFWAMLDAREIDLRWLGYIASIYGIEISEEVLNEISLREWVENLPYFLKRIGTYNALYVVWKVFVQNTQNQLNVYERWGEWCTQTLDISAGNFTDDFIDHHFLEFYGTQPSGGAGDYYYSQYAPSGYPSHTQVAPSTCTPTTSGNYVLTPHYKVQIDLTTEPLGDIFDDGTIISQDVIEELYRNFEYVRPVMKYAHYEELIAPLATMKSNVSRRLYPLLSNGYLNTFFTPSAGFGPYTYSYFQSTASTTWNITHNLNSEYVLAQCWMFTGMDETNSEIVMPEDIQIIDNNTIQITFADPTMGVAAIAGDYITGVTYIGNVSGGGNPWNYTHNLFSSPASGYPANVGPVAMHYDNAGYMIMPDINDMLTDDTFRATWATTTSGGTLIRRSDYIHTQSDPSTQWYVNHNLSAWVIVQCYDITTNEEIFPDNVVLTDYNNLEIHWSSVTRGYAHVITVTKSNLVYNLYECDEFGLGMCPNTLGYWKVGDGTSTLWNPFSQNDLYSPQASGRYYSIGDDLYNIYIDFIVPQTDDDINITEVGLFNYFDNLIFYSRTSGMYKLADGQAYFHYRIGKTTSSSSSSSSSSESSSSSSESSS